MALFFWLAVESLSAYSRSRLKLRVGLGDPIVSNRFLLIGLYGALAAVTYPTYLWMYIMYERHGIWSDPLSVFTGILEVLSLAALWTSFAAPAFYRRWIAKAQAKSQLRVGLRPELLRRIAAPFWNRAQRGLAVGL